MKARQGVKAHHFHTNFISQNPMAVAALVVALAMGIAGAVLLGRAIADQPVRAAQVEGLHLRLEDTRWLVDQMHDSQGQVFAMPASMMPDLPSHDLQRLYVEFTLHNRSQNPKRFRDDELQLRSNEGAKVVSMSSGLSVASQTRGVPLEPGQMITTFVSFDVSEPGDDLHLVWARDGTTVTLQVSNRPDEGHIH